MLSTMGARIKRFYDGKLWTKEQVHIVTGIGSITQEEYKVITGEDYVVPFTE